MINARAETVATKPAFRRALVERRCVIPCDGFYEWRSIAGRKQPFHISLAAAARAAHGGLLPLAGLWDLWRRDGQPVESCAIITTAANSEMAQLHDRMPAILTPEALDAWLDPDLEDPARLAALLRPYEGSLAVREANRLVNSPRNDSPACLAGEQGMFD
jgi:putative SOS response-associated peptidase YedK